MSQVRGILQLEGACHEGTKWAGAEGSLAPVSSKQFRVVDYVRHESGRGVPEDMTLGVGSCTTDSEKERR